MFEQPHFNRLVGMYGNGRPRNTSGFPINVVATVDAEQRPSVLFEQAAEVFA
jgi:hypothetical protein